MLIIDSIHWNFLLALLVISLRLRAVYSEHKTPRAECSHIDVAAFASDCCVLLCGSGKQSKASAASLLHSQSLLFLLLLLLM